VPFLLATIFLPAVRLFTRREIAMQVVLFTRCRWSFRLAWPVAITGCLARASTAAIPTFV
jgi:hypothetical protein